MCLSFFSLCYIQYWSQTDTVHGFHMLLVNELWGFLACWNYRKFFPRFTILFFLFYLLLFFFFRIVIDNLLLGFWPTHLISYFSLPAWRTILLRSTHRDFSQNFVSHPFGLFCNVFSSSYLSQRFKIKLYWWGALSVFGENDL